MKFVTYPNLPVNVSDIVIGEKYAEILRKPLKKLGINIILLPDNPFVDKRLSSHADLSVLHAGGERIALAPYLKNSKFAEYLVGLGFELFFPDINQTEKYPEDSQMNVCIVGRKAILGKKNGSETIIKYLTNIDRLELIHSRQGYARCSTCVVNENAIITSDCGIYKSALAHGVDALHISAGYIGLDGYEYGFIGGASFKLDKNNIAFTGTLDTHPDKDKILSFLGLHNINPVYITELPVFDIGSAIPLTEK